MEVKKKPLSKSALEKYLNCPFGYDQHYNKRVRPSKVGSPLVFGIGIDAGLNAILGKSKVDPIFAFKNAIKHIQLGKMTVSYFDYDKYIIPWQVKKDALKFVKKLGYKGKNIDDLWQELNDKKKEGLSPKQEQAIDYLARLSFEYKAKIIFDAYKKQVMPRIKKVHAIQKFTRAGVLDLVADWDKVGNRYVIDNKTASSEYEENATDYSFQLTDYAIDEKCDNIMFIVIPKKIDSVFTKTCEKCKKPWTSQHKTCPVEKNGKRCNGQGKTVVTHDVQIQCVPGKVTDMMKKNTVNIRCDVTKAIENKIFPCNFATCGNKFGRPCDYRELYWKGDFTGLEKVEDSKGKKK